MLKFHWESRKHDKSLKLRLNHNPYWTSCQHSTMSDNLLTTIKVRPSPLSYLLPRQLSQLDKCIKIEPPSLKFFGFLHTWFLSRETFLSGSHLCDTKILFFFLSLVSTSNPSISHDTKNGNPQAPYSCDSGQLCSVVQGFGVRVKLQKEIREYVETWRPKKQPYIGAWGRINGRNRYWQGQDSIMTRWVSFVKKPAERYFALSRRSTSKRWFALM